MFAVDPPASAELLQGWLDGDVTVFVGAGASVGSGLPTWKDLLALLASEIDDLPPDTDLPTAAYYYELAFGRRQLVSVLTNALRRGTPGVTGPH